MTTDAEIGQNVREERKLHRMSQKTLGVYLKVSAQQVQKYERGLNRISASKLQKIAQLFGCSMEWLCRARSPNMHSASQINLALTSSSL